MTGKVRILFLSANPWTTSRILVDEEAREIFERIQEGPYRSRFELHQHTATRPIDLQRLLLMYQPHIVHFSGHGSKRQRIILGGTPGRGKTVDIQGLVEVFALYNAHVRVVLLNACFTNVQARLISGVIDYSVGTGKGIGDKAGVAFAGAFYRALGFGKSIREAFGSAKAELALTKMPRTQGIELFVRDGINDHDPFPQVNSHPEDQNASYSGIHTQLVLKRTEEITVFRRSGIRTIKRIRSEIALGRPAGVMLKRGNYARLAGLCWGDCSTSHHEYKGDRKMAVNSNMKQQRTEKNSPASFRKSRTKATRTRVGVLEDWRGESTKSERLSGGVGKTLRDGR